LNARLAEHAEKTLADLKADQIRQQVTKLVIDRRSRVPSVAADRTSPRRSSAGTPISLWRRMASRVR
jgi:hypothetical protein